MTHRTKKPFECSFEGCTKSYCDARSLRRHLENHHNVPTETLYDMSLNNYGMSNGKGLLLYYILSDLMWVVLNVFCGLFLRCDVRLADTVIGKK